MAAINEGKEPAPRQLQAEKNRLAILAQGNKSFEDDRSSQRSQATNKQPSHMLQ